MTVRGRGNRPPSKGIDPVLYIPDGVQDLYYVLEETDRLSDEDGDDEELEDLDPISDGGEEPDGGGGGGGGGGLGKPGSPDIIKVLKQTLRTKKDGSQVVDIVVAITRKNRADGYKFRVTKVSSGKSNVYKIDEDGNVIGQAGN